MYETHAQAGSQWSAAASFIVYYFRPIGDYNYAVEKQMSDSTGDQMLKNFKLLIDEDGMNWCRLDAEWRCFSSLSKLQLKDFDFVDANYCLLKTVEGRIQSVTWLVDTNIGRKQFLGLDPVSSLAAVISRDEDVSEQLQRRAIQHRDAFVECIRDEDDVTWLVNGCLEWHFQLLVDCSSSKTCRWRTAVLGVDLKSIEKVTQYARPSIIITTAMNLFMH